MLLAIDTATHYLGLALYDGAMVIGEQTWRTGNRQNTLLAPSIKTLLDVCDVAMHDLSAVAVAIGPGSYTGLRIGVALAKGMAAMRNLPLIGVSTLDILAVAHHVPDMQTHLLTVVPAGRGRIITATYQPENQPENDNAQATIQSARWQMDAEPSISQWQPVLAHLHDQLRADATRRYLITGEISESGREAIAAVADDRLSMSDGAQRLRRAGYLAQEAWRRLKDGTTASFTPAKLLPVYLKTDN